MTNVVSNAISNDTFGLRPLSGTWRTFPGARLANGRGLEAVIAGVTTWCVGVAEMEMTTARITTAQMDIA